MHSHHIWRRWLGRLCAGTGFALLALSPAFAQVAQTQGTCCPPPPCGAPVYRAPGMATPTWPPAAAPAPSAAAPSPAAPSTAAPSPMPPVSGPEVAPSVSIAPESSGLALSGSTVAMAAPGYVDFAVPVSQFRLRYDAAYDDNRPDRAEFFYGKCGCFAAQGVRAPGPPLLETRVDYQEVRPYLEYALNNRFSAFIEAPIRFINPEQNANEAGFSNLLAGFKYAMVACPDQYLTFQFSVSTPTADVDRGLGNELTALEPGILYYRQLTDRLAWHAELRDWIPIGGTDFAGNILRYGSALSYVAASGCNWRVTPIGEMVGWTVLGGKELVVANPGVPNGNADPTLGVPAFTSVKDAAGDTIVNAKVGVRFGFGPLVGPANLSRSDLYIGYGRALTGTVWYKDILRVEYGWRF